MTALQRRSRLGLAAFALVCATYFAAVVFVFFPGVKNWDTYEQLNQALVGEYRTTFTVGYAWLLGMSHRLCGSTGGLWLVQLALVLGAMIWLVDRARAGVVVVVVAVAVFCLPPLAFGLVQQWRDVWVAAFGLICFGGLLARRPFVVLAAGVAAAIFRSNAMVLGLLPAALVTRDMIVVRLRRRGPVSRQRRWLAAAVGAVAFVVLCSLTSSLLAAVLDAKPGFPAGPSLVFDVADIWRRDPSLQKKSAVGHKLAKQAARKVDECHAHNVVDGRVPELAVNELNGKRDKLIKDWMTVVKKRPDLYLQHKRRAIECMLRIDYDSGERFSYYLISRGAHGLGAGDPRQSRPGLIELQKKFWSTADLRGTWADWFEPLLWLALLSVASLVAVFRTRSRGLVSAFVLGNVMFLFSNFTFAPAPNLRYLFPLLTALWATAVVAAAGRRLRRSPRRIWRERRSAVASVGDVRQEEP